MKIEANEDKIIGRTRLDGSDEQSERITWLVNNYLTKIVSDGVNWTILYQDPEDKRYWELVFPQGELQGGGPPSLLLISEVEAKSKYNI